MEDEREKGTRKRRCCEAKNDLKNPSKGKYRRISPAAGRISPAVGGPQGRSWDDEALLKKYGMKSSQIRLSPIRGQGDTPLRADSPKKQMVNIGTSEKRHGEIAVTTISSTKSCDRPTSKTVTISVDSDSDVEIIEDTDECIVLDDDLSLKENVGVNKDAELMKKYGVQNVCVKLNPIGSGHVKLNPIGREQIELLPDNKVSTDHSFSFDKHFGKTDRYALNEFGLRDLCVKLDKIDDKKRHGGMTQVNRTTAKMFDEIDFTLKKNIDHSLAPKSIVSVKKLDEMSPADLDKMLKDCGMGVSIPWSVADSSQLKTSGDSSKPVGESVKGSRKKDFNRSDIKPKRKQRSPSPQPSTSSGFRGKRKRTARKSVPSTELAVKYDLKEPKILVKSLSKIEIALLKNPHSLFGKSNRSKHKFDSDDSDEVEWDIPNSPVMDDIEEPFHTSANIGSSMSKQGRHKIFNNHATKNATEVKCGIRNSNNDTEILRQFGLLDSKVLLSVSDCSMTNTVPKDVNKSIQEHTETDSKLLEQFGISDSDSKLLEKFGMSQAKVVVEGFKEVNANTASRNQNNATAKSTCTKDESNETRLIRKRRKVKVKTIRSVQSKQVSSKEECVSKGSGVNPQGSPDEEMTKQIRSKTNVPVIGTNVENGPPTGRYVYKETKRKCRSAMDKLRLKSLSRAKENAAFGKLGTIINPIKQRTTNISQKIIRNDKNASAHLKNPRKPYMNTHAKLMTLKKIRKSKHRDRKIRKNCMTMVLLDLEDTESMNGAEDKENEGRVTCRDEVDGDQMLRSICSENQSDSINKDRNMCDQTNVDTSIVIAKDFGDLTGGCDHGDTVKHVNKSSIKNDTSNGAKEDAGVSEDTSEAALCLVECDSDVELGEDSSEVISLEQDNDGATKQSALVAHDPGIIVDSTSNTIVGDLIINRCEVIINKSDLVNAEKD